MIHVLIVSMYQRFETLKKNLTTLDLPSGVQRHILIQCAPMDVREAMWRLAETNLGATLTQANRGCGGGRQWMIDRIDPKHDDILVFLDDDIYATNSRWLHDLALPIQDQRAEIVGVEGRKLLLNLMTEPTRLNPDYVSGGWCAISAEVFHAGCRFDERYINYYEDADFCRQATTRGFRLHVVGNIGLVHDSLGGNSVVMLESRQKFAQKWGIDLTEAR